MSYNGKTVHFADFSGGLQSNLCPTGVPINAAWDLDNVYVTTGAGGFRSRLGSTRHNPSALQTSGDNSIEGLGYFLNSAGNDYLLAVCGAKLFASGAGQTTTMTDITGSLTITPAFINLWSFASFNDKVVGFGGAVGGFDAPFVWTGTGDATALGGSAPHAYGCFSANNRLFAFRTTSSPSSIYWSIIANEADWTGVGSGSAVVGSINDNEMITAAVPLGNNDVIVFKENSTYDMVITEAPFPVYSLYRNVGCAGKHAALSVDGVIYFITKQGRMKATTGSELVSFPPVADDKWNLTVQSGSLRYCQGFRHRGEDFDHIVWIVNDQSTNLVKRRAIIWDLLNKCWLYNSTGFLVNVALTTPADVVYLGDYDGFILKPEQAGVYADSITGNNITITYGTPSVGSTVIFTGLPTDGTKTFTCVASAPGANEFSSIAELNTLINGLTSLNSTASATVITITQAVTVTGATLTGTGSYVALSKTFRDGLDASTGSIAAYWRTGWMQQTSFEGITEARKITLAVDKKTTGTMDISWGYDFNTDANTVSLAQTSSLAYALINTRLTGRGNLLNFKIAHTSATIDFNVQEFQISGKSYGQKDPTAS